MEDLNQLELFNEDNWDKEKKPDPLSDTEDIFRDIETEAEEDPDIKENLRHDDCASLKDAVKSNSIARDKLIKQITRIITSSRNRK